MQWADSTTGGVFTTSPFFMFKPFKNGYIKTIKYIL